MRNWKRANKIARALCRQLGWQAQWYIVPRGRGYRIVVLCDNGTMATRTV